MTKRAEVLSEATKRLAAAGVESPRFDAEALLGYCLGVRRGLLMMVDDVPAPEQEHFLALLNKREARVPLQHLIGEAAFRHITVVVGPGVFIPRPETELLVDAVLPALEPADEPVVVDLCSGTGALALAIEDEVDDVHVYAVERSPDALRWLRRNVRRLHSAVTVVEADVSDASLLPELRGRVDVVVCNPPYVPSTTEVEPEVRADPDDAVFAGADGLALMPAVIARAAELLRPYGVLAVEHDDTQGETVPALLNEDGRWVEVVDHSDLTGRPRYVIARRR